MLFHWSAGSPGVECSFGLFLLGRRSRFLCLLPFLQCLAGPASFIRIFGFFLCGTGLHLLAHGLDHIYPSSHRNTAAEMVAHGGLLTEYPGYHAMHPAFFVARNRIVAGLADAVVIVESREKGGALITAGIAESYHRDVFALPGDIHRESSAGCNHLIRRNRAALITSADDLVEAMCWQAPRREAVQRSLFPDLTDEEQPIVDYLKARGEGQINRMTVELNRPLSQLLSVLVELEFKGVVKALPGGVYKL